VRLEAIAGDPKWESIRRRLEEKSIPEPNSGCLLWFGAYHQFGYGRLNIDGEIISAHCLSYAVSNGIVGASDQVLHRCDVPSCINPAHLYLGDDKQNAADRMARGRNPCRKGENAGRAKLTDEQVRAIRADPRSLRKIAAAYGISKGPVTAIKAGRSWSHVT
jgi:hypothetical protein